MSTTAHNVVVTSLPDPQRGFVFEAGQYRRFANLAEAFYYNANVNPQAVAYDQAQADPAHPEAPRKYTSSTNGQRKQRVLGVAHYLESLGVGRGDVVAIVSLDRPEWTEAELAAYTVGACVTAAYVRDNDERLGALLRDAGAICAFAENQQQFDRLLRLIGDAGSPLSIRHVITFEEVDAPSHPAVSVSSFRDIATQPVRDEDSFAWVETSRDEPAFIFYTSGSDGWPKGVPVTQAQVLENLAQVAGAEVIEYARFENSPGLQPYLTFILPERAHAYPARCALLVATSPARARYPAIVNRCTSHIDAAYRESIRRDLREGGAGLIVIVPKILISIQQRVRQRLATGRWSERFALSVVEQATQKLCRSARRERRLAADVLCQLLKPVHRAVAGRIRRDIVGPEFDYFVSGGAKLPIETAAFLWSIGLPVYEGYGSTETNCPIASNTPRRHRLGSVGHLFEGVECRIDPTTNEVLLRGANLATHYRQRPDESASTWDADGWYHSRDIGHLDDDGYLYIGDRLDNILVLQNGKNVSATAIESRFAAIPYVETAMVVGHQRPNLAALLVLDERAIRCWAEVQGQPLQEDWRHDPAVTALLRREVDLHVNRAATHGYEGVQQFAVIDALSPDDQTLTATEKVRRKALERKHHDLIEHLYNLPSDWSAPKNCVAAAPADCVG